MSTAHKIIDGLKDAIAGNFTRITVEGQTWVRADNLAALVKALEPFAKGAAQIPDAWPPGRGLLIGENHPHNPKPYSLLLAYVDDFRRARAALSAFEQGKGGGS